MASLQKQTNIEKSDEKLIGSTIGNQYKITKILGKGSFGVCYEGVDNTNSQKYAIKVENMNISQVSRSLLKEEINCYELLKGVEGIPKLIVHGCDKDMYLIVYELLGNDLSKIFHDFNKKFSLKTIFMLAEQMIRRIKSVHSRHIVHRDLKPENWLIDSIERQSKDIFLIDFGLVKLYYNEKENKHLPQKQCKALTGTVRYCSLNTHNAQTLSRRDDLESIAYILMYFIAGTLPWDGWESRVEDKFYIDVKLQKELLLDHQFCQQMPKVIKQFLKYCRLLEYEETPDYNYWVNKFREQQLEYNFVWDYKYDWIQS